MHPATIIEKDVVVLPGMAVGYEDDRRRFMVSEGGVVVTPKGMRFQ